MFSAVLVRYLTSCEPLQVSALARDLTDSSSSSDERMAELQAQLQTTTGLLEEAQHNVSELEKKVEAAQATMSQQNQV